jgi:hypothetical protein
VPGKTTQRQRSDDESTRIRIELHGASPYSHFAGRFAAEGITARSLVLKGLEKNSADQTVQFEVAEDVLVDGVALVRRGALATGHFTNIKKAKGYGRHAEVEFVCDAAIAVDGQSTSITGAGERTTPKGAMPTSICARGARTNETVSTAVLLPALGWLAKGADVLIRAGTSYDLEVSGQHAVQVGR